MVSFNAENSFSGPVLSAEKSAIFLRNVLKMIFSGHPLMMRVDFILSEAKRGLTTFEVSDESQCFLGCLASPNMFGLG